MLGLRIAASSAVLTLGVAQSTAPSCKFWFPDEGYEFDLSTLRDAQPLTYTYSGAFKYMFTVCQNLTSNPCPPGGNFAAALQLFNTGVSCQANWGYLPSAQPSLLSSDPTKGLNIDYIGESCVGSQFGGRYSTRLSIACDPNAQNASFTGATMTTGNCGISFQFKSAAACPYRKYKQESVMSAGAIAGIVVVLALGLYLFGGIAYKRYRYGASGVEAIPNIDTWRCIGRVVADYCCCGLCSGHGGRGKQQLGEESHYTSVDTA